MGDEVIFIVIFILAIIGVSLNLNNTNRENKSSFSEKYIRRRFGNGDPGTLNTIFTFCPNSTNIWHSCTKYCLRYCPRNELNKGEAIFTQLQFVHEST